MESDTNSMDVVNDIATDTGNMALDHEDEESDSDASYVGSWMSDVEPYTGDTITLTLPDVGMTAKDCVRALQRGLNPFNGVANIARIQQTLDVRPYASLKLFRPFHKYVKERVIDLSALNNSDCDKCGDECNKPDYEFYTKLDDQVLLDLLTTRFNEWLVEMRKVKSSPPHAEQSDALEDMSTLGNLSKRLVEACSLIHRLDCERVKFVGGLPKGYVFVSKERKPPQGPPRQSKTQTEADKKRKKKKTAARKTTPDKFIFSHPHPCATPFDSVAKFVLHVYWMLGRHMAGSHNERCECSKCEETYADIATWSSD
jgi:hypothetical protein